MASGRGLVGLGFVKVWTVFLAYHLEWQGEATWEKQVQQHQTTWI